MPEPGTVAIVLPPKEGFSPDAAGAIALLVRRLARRSSRPTLVLGLAGARSPFGDVRFQALRPGFWPPARLNQRYAAAAAEALALASPALVEVHNRPEVALHITEQLPGVPTSLFLHNDPQGMRCAGAPEQRVALLDRLARVVTVSSHLQARFLEGISAPVRRAPAVLPNCIDFTELPPPLAPDRRERLILFAGRVVADKGADSFVAACGRALPMLPGWRAEMIGADRFSDASPETAFIRRLRPLAATAGVPLHGYRPHAEVLAAMARAAIVIVPSRWPEPFGMTALEAMASGAAVICSRRGGLPEVAGDAAVYADPDDPAALAEAIRTLALDAAQRAMLAETGRVRARRFDVTEIAAALERLRAEMLAA